MARARDGAESDLRCRVNSQAEILSLELRRFLVA